MPWTGTQPHWPSEFILSAVISGWTELDSPSWELGDPGLLGWGNLRPRARDWSLLPALTSDPAREAAE